MTLSEDQTDLMHDVHFGLIKNRIDKNVDKNPVVYQGPLSFVLLRRQTALYVLMSIFLKTFC